MTTTVPTRSARSARGLSRRAALAGALLLPLAACSGGGSSDSSGSGSGSGASDGGADASASASGVQIEDAWVKATDSDMTGAFARISNTSDKDLKLVAARCDAAGMVELHEVTDGTMRAVKGGLPLPAHGKLMLEPGGYHVMLMDLKKALKPGEEVDITLELSDGSTVPMKAVIKDYAGAKEDYSPGGGASDGGGMDHGGHDHDHDHEGHDHEGHDHGHEGHDHGHDHKGHDHDDHKGHEDHGH